MKAERLSEKRNSRRRWISPCGCNWIGGLLAGWIIFVVAGGCLAWFSSPVENFGCVEPDCLYRSAQPSAEGLRVVQKRHGIRTVINLRSPDTVRTRPLPQEEVAFARNHGMRFINLPYGDPSPETQIEKFLAIMDDPANHPVLIHCAEGKERSGVMVAAWRMRKQGWSYDRAVAEMESFGFSPPEKPEMCAALRRISVPPKGKTPPDRAARSRLAGGSSL